MGWIDEEFDHACIKHFQDGDEAQLDAFLTGNCRAPATARTKCATG